MEDLLKEIELQGRRISKIEGLLSISKNVLSLDEVSVLTGLSKSHLYKLTHKRRIPHFKQGKFLFFDRSEIEKWLKENRICSVQEIDAIAASISITRPS